MDKRIIQFVNALRASGVRVSLAESADAFRAVEQLSILQRETFRASLRTTLIKDSQDLARFDELFPLFFQSGDPPPMLTPGQDLTPEQAQKLAEMLRKFNQDLRNLLDKLLTGRPLTQAELEKLDDIYQLDQMTDIRHQEWLARQMEQALHFPELRKAVDEMIKLFNKMGMESEKIEQFLQMLKANQQTLQQQIRQHIGQRTAENLARQGRQPPSDRLGQTPFQSLTEEDMQHLRHEVRRLAAALRTRLALRLRRARTGTLDLKATLRSNLKNGGIPFQLRYRDHTLKPRIVVICDISTSMRYCSELMLGMLYAIQDQISKTHAFAFVDHLEYISPDFDHRQPGQSIAEIMQRLPSGYYNTNLGASLKQFTRDYQALLDPHTTLLMVGDARNNYNDPQLEIFRALARRCRSAIWLNPEPTALWGTGDSDMLKYAPFCQRIFQVGNLEQLAAAFDQLLIHSVSP